MLGHLQASLDSKGVRTFIFILLSGSIIFVVTKNSSYQSPLYQEPRSSEDASPNPPTDKEGVFSEIYDKRLWGNDGGGSGEGSSMKFTKRTRALVEMLVYKYNIDLLVDAPCGAMTWMPSVLERIHEARPSFKYVGVDIVPSVIANNTERIKQKYIAFRQHDFSSGPITGLPRSTKSAIFSRDALQHLAYDVIISALESFAKTSVDYLIIGSYYKHGTLAEINTGDYFPFDVSKVDDFPTPLDVISEETPDFKHMVVFERNALRNFPFKEKMTKSLKNQKE